PAALRLQGWKMVQKPWRRRSMKKHLQRHPPWQACGSVIPVSPSLRRFLLQTQLPLRPPNDATALESAVRARLHVRDSALEEAPDLEQEQLLLLRTCRVLIE